MEYVMTALRWWRPGADRTPEKPGRVTRAPARRATGPAARPAASRAVAGRSMFLQQRVGFRFVSEAISELKKVTWPTRQQARSLTLVVIGVSVAVGVVLGGMDYFFEGLFETLLRLR